MWLWFPSNTRWGAIILKINRAGYGGGVFGTKMTIFNPEFFADPYPLDEMLCGVDPPVSTEILMDDTRKFGYNVYHMGLIRLDWSAGGL